MIIDQFHIIFIFLKIIIFFYYFLFFYFYFLLFSLPPPSVPTSWSSACTSQSSRCQTGWTGYHPDWVLEASHEISEEEWGGSSLHHHLPVRPGPAPVDRVDLLSCLGRDESGSCLQSSSLLCELLKFILFIYLLLSLLETIYNFETLWI